MIKLGLAGTWHVHFKGYVRQFLDTGKCELACLWDPDAEKAAAAGEELGIPATNDIDAFFKEDFDAVMVCCETVLHPQVYLKAAAAKKHIFTEKVLTEKPEDAIKVQKAVEESGVKFCISFPWRSRADFLWIKNAVDSGLLGEISSVRMRNAHNGVSAGWLPAGFLDREITCGGAMMDLGAHSMYILNWLLGEPQAATSVFTNMLCKSVEDNCVSVLKYKSGAVGINETAFVAQNDPFSLEVCGTKGTALCGWDSDRLTVNTGNGWEQPDLPENAPTPVQLFVGGILGENEIPYGIEDAVELTKTMWLAYSNII